MEGPQHRRAKHNTVGCGVEEVSPEVRVQEGFGHMEFGLLGKKERSVEGLRAGGGQRPEVRFHFRESRIQEWRSVVSNPGLDSPWRGAPSKD